MVRPDLKAASAHCHQVHTYLQRTTNNSQVRDAVPSHTVGRVTIFSHWEN